MYLCFGKTHPVVVVFSYSHLIQSLYLKMTFKYQLIDLFRSCIHYAMDHQLIWKTKLLMLWTSSITIQILKSEERPIKSLPDIGGPGNGTSCEISSYRKVSHSHRVTDPCLPLHSLPRLSPSHCTWVCNLHGAALCGYCRQSLEAMLLSWCHC